MKTILIRKSYINFQSDVPVSGAHLTRNKWRAMEAFLKRQKVKISTGVGLPVWTYDYITDRYSSQFGAWAEVSQDVVTVLKSVVRFPIGAKDADLLGGLSLGDAILWAGRRELLGR